MTTWYTADNHFGHANIIALCDRPFRDVDEMNGAMIERWNAVVAPTDDVWVLGDFSLTPKVLWPVRRLNGRKTLVAGNHDACWQRHRRYRKAVDLYREAGFAGVVASGIVNVHRLPGGIVVRMAHLPYHGDSQAEDRYADWRPADDGLPLLCGHVHDKWKTREKMINVGVDVRDFTPVSEHEIVDEVRNFYRIGGAPGHLVTSPGHRT